MIAHDPCGEALLVLLTQWDLSPDEVERFRTEYKASFAKQPHATQCMILANPRGRYAEALMKSVIDRAGLQLRPRHVHDQEWLDMQAAARRVNWLILGLALAAIAIIAMCAARGMGL